tara:strand:+ start:152 stop:376 length:225 start_codon:yes stop_codon:yes gene_type:complete
MKLLAILILAITSMTTHPSQDYKEMREYKEIQKTAYCKDGADAIPDTVYYITDTVLGRTYMMTIIPPTFKDTVK